MDELKLESFDEVNVLLPRLLSILPPMGGIYLGWNHGCENKARSSSPSARGPEDFPKTRRLIAWFCRMKNTQSCPFIWLRLSLGWNLVGNVVKSKTSGPYSSLTIACEFSLTSSFFRCGNLGLLNLRPNSQLDSCNFSVWPDRMRFSTSSTNVRSTCRPVCVCVAVPRLQMLYPICI